MILILFTGLSYAQVGINTNTPDASSALEIESTTGGILIPRMTEIQRDAIVAPAAGLMIYQTDESSGFYFCNGTAWTKIDGAPTISQNKSLKISHVKSTFPVLSSHPWHLANLIFFLILHHLIQCQIWRSMSLSRPSVSSPSNSSCIWIQRKA